MEYLAKFFESDLFVAITLSILTFIGLMIGKRIVWRVFERATKATAVTWDDELLVRLNAPVRVLILFIAFLVGLNLYPELIAKHHSLIHLHRAGFIIICTWIISRTVVVFLKSFLAANNISLGTQHFISAAFQVSVWILGLLGLLDTFGISITPIIASLGVGSLAVALALQDTLGNLFAGIYIYFDQPISVGDFVRLEDGSEGHIIKIGWRSTQLKLPTDNIIVMPNTKMANSIITNYDLEIAESTFTLPLGVAYDSDLAHVEQITIDVAKKVMAKVDGAANEFPPAVRFTSFADSSINFNLVLRVKHRTKQGLLVHEMIKAIHETYAKEKIDIPFPQRVIHVTKSDLSLDL